MKNDQWSLSRIIKDSISIIFLNFYDAKKKENRRKFMECMIKLPLFVMIQNQYYH